jgi:hypothetical protein
LAVVGSTDQGTSALDTTHLTPVQSIFEGTVTCDFPINSGPQHYVLSAALRRLAGWVKSGRGPASAPLLSVDPGFPPRIRRDHLGNALGGIRTPEMDVPIATLSGGGQSGSLLCLLLGTTVPFDSATLASLYPDHGAYVGKFARATRRAQRAGFIRRHDAKLMAASAAASNVGR